MGSWKFRRPWLRYNAKTKLMFCDICVKAQVLNTFTTGCDMLKKKSVVKHESKGKYRRYYLNHLKMCTSNSSHTFSLTVLKEGENMQVAKEKSVNKSKTAIISAMKNVLFSARNDLANSMRATLLKDCMLINILHMNTTPKHTTYEHHTSIREF
ncbi:hypothetical protein KUTeg_022497 [Tegillarca granosa]|uniref:C17orf113 probable zinc finger domain-containing protein n=1 Tax=Tegillarca granosa TaxID=220873 RepID=A0ABQ9E6F0_TEGGR|nr:hypothetical protein KUTeg_022497 [Tegillarca granosa]